MKNKTSAKINAFANIVKNYREAQNYKTENALYNAIQEIGWQRYNTSYRNSLTKEPAEEALNDVALAVLRLPFSNDSTAYQYVVKSCHNAFKDELRKKKKYSNTESYSATEDSEPFVIEAANKISEEVCNIEDDTHDNEKVNMEKLDRATPKLGKQQRIVIEGIRNGCSTEEFMKKHGLTDKKVHMTKHLAIKNIKKHLE